MCRNGLYTERGIKEIHGYGSERWTVECNYAVKLDPSLDEVGVLMEPTTILAKAWDHVDRIGSRAWLLPSARWSPARARSACWLRCSEPSAASRCMSSTASRTARPLVHALGATYHTSDVATIEKIAPPDVVIEATGVPRLVFDVMQHNAAAGVVCLTGVSPTGRDLSVDAGQLGRDIVLANDVIFGSVNANLAHYELAERALASADRSWLASMITRRVPLERFEEALDSRDDDVKVVLDLRS